MAELLMWSGHEGIVFGASEGEIRAFKDLSISVSAETDDKTKNKEKYTVKKNTGSYKITMTGILSASLGVDVQQTATAMTEAARNGENGYFYIGGNKLFPAPFMATDATIQNMKLSADGIWTYCEVQWTLKQCDKFGEEETGTAKKKTTKKSTKKTKTTTATGTGTTATTTGSASLANLKSLGGKIADTLKDSAQKVSAALKATNSAKNASATTTTVKKVATRNVRVVNAVK